MIRQIAWRRLATFFCWTALALPLMAEEGDAKKKAAEAEKEKAYFEMIKLFADTLDQVDRNYVKEIDRRKLIEGAIRGMLADQDVRLEIYNILGQKVRTLVNEIGSAGSHEVRWDGTNQFGHKVASGMYIYRLVAGEFIATKRMVLMQ